MHVVVIGAYGSAGAAVAEGLGPHVGDAVSELTLIDDGEPGGGLCILEGCMPSKEVLSAAAHRHHGHADGRLTGEPHELDLAAIVDRKDDRTRGWAAHRREAIHELAERDGVRFLHDRARFVDDCVIEAGGERFAADYVVVATGSTVQVPELPGIEEVDYRTSKDLLHATELPDSAVVMGFGYVGMEMTPYLAEAGVDVTAVEHDERPLDEADPEFGDAAMEIYREEFGIEIVTGGYETAVESVDDGVRVDLDNGKSVAGDELFCFTGREPTLDGLGLENTRLEPEEGWIDATMRPPNDDRVFVVGDANGRDPILHVAKEQGQVAARNVLAHGNGEPLEAYENVHHHVIFAGLGVYPFARVGHSETSAREAGRDPIVVTRQASDDGVFLTKDAPEGLARLVVDPDKGTVLGYQGLHLHADVMAKTMQVIVECGLDVREVPDRAYHPTTPEILDGLFRAAADAL